MTNITMTMTKAEAEVATRIAGCFTRPHPTEDRVMVIARFTSLAALEEFIHTVRVSAAGGSTNAGSQVKPITFAERDKHFRMNMPSNVKSAADLDDLWKEE